MHYHAEKISRFQFIGRYENKKTGNDVKFVKQVIGEFELNPNNTNTRVPNLTKLFLKKAANTKSWKELWMIMQQQRPVIKAEEKKRGAGKVLKNKKVKFGKTPRQTSNTYTDCYSFITTTGRSWAYTYKL